MDKLSLHKHSNYIWKKRKNERLLSAHSQAVEKLSTVFYFIPFLITALICVIIVSKF